MRSALTLNVNPNRTVAGRKFRFIGVNDLARRMGVDRSLVSIVLSGKRKPSAEFKRRYRAVTKRDLNQCHGVALKKG